MPVKPKASRRKFFQVSGLVVAAKLLNFDTIGTTAGPSLDELLEAARQRGDLPAVAGGIMKDGKIVDLGAVGVRKLGEAVKVARGDVFHLGSCTKTFTATLAGILVDQGAIQWKDSLAKIFPERSDKMHPKFRDVTLELLLQHRSGILSTKWRELNVPGTPKIGDFGSNKLSLLERRLLAMDSIVAREPQAEPGVTTAYDNSNYWLAASMLERVADLAYENLMSRWVFRPLSMATAGFGPTSHPNKLDQPWAHEYKDKVWKPIHGDNAPPHNSSGRVHSSVADYLKFVDLHASDGDRPQGILKAATCRIMRQAPAGAEYALGWVMTSKYPWSKGPVAWHSGSNTFNFSLGLAAPGIGACIVVASNGCVLADQKSDHADATSAVLFQLANQLGQKYFG